MLINPQILETYTKVPVLYVKLPSGSKSSKNKQIASSILKELGDPLYYKGTVIELTNRANDLVQKCEVELIIFDEFQHVIDTDTRKVLRQAADWLKNFAETVQVPIIFSGLPESKKIFKVKKS